MPQSTPLYALAARLNVVANFAFCPRQGQTFCNDYASVFCAGYGVVLPPVKANEQVVWLANSKDWTEIGKDEAIVRANGNQLVVACIALEPHGHIAVLVESPDSDPSGCYVSAAGAHNAVRCTLAQQFGDLQPRFFMSIAA